MMFLIKADTDEKVKLPYNFKQVLYLDVFGAQMGTDFELEDTGNKRADDGKLVKVDEHEQFKLDEKIIGSLLALEIATVHQHVALPASLKMIVRGFREQVDFLIFTSLEILAP